MDGVRNPEWEKVILDNVRKCNISKYTKICSKHFEEECFKPRKPGEKRFLLPDSKPTKFLRKENSEVEVSENK